MLPRTCSVRASRIGTCGRTDLPTHFSSPDPDPGHPDPVVHSSRDQPSGQQLAERTHWCRPHGQHHNAPAGTTGCTDHPDLRAHRNVLVVIALSASATTFFLMARRFVNWWPAALEAFSTGSQPPRWLWGPAHISSCCCSKPSRRSSSSSLTSFPTWWSRSPLWYGLTFGGCFVAGSGGDRLAGRHDHHRTRIGLAPAGPAAIRRQLGGAGESVERPDS